MEQLNGFELAGRALRITAIDEEEEQQREKPFGFGGGNGQSQQQQQGRPGALAAEEVFPY